MLRKFIFWSHLIVGISAGVVIFIMSATGVLLTYEKQIEEWDEARHSVKAQDQQQRLTTDTVLTIMRKKHPDENHFYIRWVNEEGRAIPAWAGKHSYLISPYSGEIIQSGQSWVVDSLHWLTDLHRWLAFTGKQQPIGKIITAYSNLLFLFLIVSGAYLWLPRKLNWRSIKVNLTFRKQPKNKHAKHYNWHHVFGVWSLIPLFFIVITATIFHFPWANQAIYGIYGEDAPGSREKRISVEVVDGTTSYEALFGIAKQHALDNDAKNWHSMWLEFGRESGITRFYIDESLGNNYSAAYALYLGNENGKVVRVKRGTDWSKGAQAWGVARFLHTGEYFGIIGQTIAGLASLAACFLVYTGFTLSWRRLITPLLLKKPLTN